MSYSLWPSGLQHARLPSPSLSAGVCSNSCPLSRWCHPTISPSVTIFFSSCLQSFPASGSFPVSLLFTPGGRRIGVSASASVVAFLKIDWFDLLLSKGLSRDFSSTTVWKHQFFNDQTSLWKEYWSGLPCPAPGDLPNPGIEPRSLALQVDLLPSESLGKPLDELYKI